MSRSIYNYSVGSLRQQTYSNIEIILVDDGSTDRSGEICDQYAQEDDRIRVFHVDNGGNLEARNIGVQQASSDWIMFWMRMTIIIQKLLNI